MRIPNLILLVQRWWWSRQRAFDLEILWPICKEQARTIEEARRAFMVHAISEPAWVREYGESLWRVVSDLT